MNLPSGASLVEFPFGDRVVVVPKVFPDLQRPGNLESIARENRVTLLWVREPQGLFGDRWNPRRMTAEYQGNPVLRAFYDDILAVQRQRRASLVLMMGNGGYWHPEFIGRLRDQSRVVFWTGDDPEGSHITSTPFVRHYDHAFCGGVYYSRTERIVDKFREWGAPAASFVPLGACPDKYQPLGNRSDDEFFSRQRDIDLVYVGAAYRGKLWRVVVLKRHFGDRLVLAGKRWDGKGLGLKGVAVRLVRMLGGLGEILQVSESELVALYQRARVGYNCHLSFGPSNLRLYELPLNGVLQVCDCEDGLRELYALDEEVISYRTTNDAIDKIEHYLRNEEERARIARAGYHRALRDYRMEKSFGRMFAILDGARSQQSVLAASLA